MLYYLTTVPWYPAYRDPGKRFLIWTVCSLAARAYRAWAPSMSVPWDWCIEHPYVPLTRADFA